MSATPAQRRDIRLTAFALAGVALLAVVLFVRQFMSPERLDPEWLRAHDAVLFETPREIDASTLVDHRARPSDGSAFEGVWNVLFFGFTYCPDICPTTMAQLSRVEKRLRPADASRLPVRFYMVSVDPARDTPEQLARYVEHFSPGFTGLTGDFLEIHRFATQLNVPFRKVPTGNDNYSVDHGANLVLVNPRGHYAGFVTPPFDDERLTRLLEVLRARES